MKKTVAAAVAAAVVVGASATTFAAANPFSDVPAGHWAYQSVAKLAAQGVIEGYGDGTYRGDRNITRYEMAQMIAKAMAKNPSGAAKADLDRLAAERRILPARLKLTSTDSRLSSVMSWTLSAFALLNSKNMLTKLSGRAKSSTPTRTTKLTTFGLTSVVVTTAPASTPALSKTTGFSVLSLSLTSMTTGHSALVLMHTST